MTVHDTPLTELLMHRACHAAQLLNAHLRDNGDTLYSGRVTAAWQLLEGVDRDYRRNATSIKWAARQRQVRRHTPLICLERAR